MPRDRPTPSSGSWPGADRSPVGRLSRRTLLVGGGLLGLVAAGGGVGVATDLLPGRSRALRALGADGSDGQVPRTAPGRLVSGSFVSRARGGRRCGWTIAFPPGPSRDRRAAAPDGLPVVVVLHGRHNDHATAFGRDGLGLDRFLAAQIGRGGRPFALASVDGGDTYWHRRDDGEDSGAMVTEEFLPLLARHGLATDRIGLLGWSMGGFGALLLAGRLGPDRVRAVAAMSPALWHSFSASAPGAFDGAADFASVSLFGRQERLDGIGVRIDCGDSDPFHDATRDFVDGFPRRPAGGFQLGGHDRGYWRRMAPAELCFLADHR